MGNARKHIENTAARVAKEIMDGIKFVATNKKQTNCKVGTLNADRTKIKFADKSEFPCKIIGNPQQVTVACEYTPGKFLAIGPKPKFTSIDSTEDPAFYIYTLVGERSGDSLTLLDLNKNLSALIPLPPLLKAIFNDDFGVGADRKVMITPSGKHLAAWGAETIVGSKGLINDFNIVTAIFTNIGISVIDDVPIFTYKELILDSKPVASVLLQPTAVPAPAPPTTISAFGWTTTYEISGDFSFYSGETFSYINSYNNHFGVDGFDDSGVGLGGFLTEDSAGNPILEIYNSYGYTKEQIKVFRQDSQISGEGDGVTADISYTLDILGLGEDVRYHEFRKLKEINVNLALNLPAVGTSIFSNTPYNLYSGRGNITVSGLSYSSPTTFIGDGGFTSPPEPRANPFYTEPNGIPMRSGLIPAFGTLIGFAVDGSNSVSAPLYKSNITSNSISFPTATAFGITGHFYTQGFISTTVDFLYTFTKDLVNNTEAVSTLETLDYIPVATDVLSSNIFKSKKNGTRVALNSGPTTYFLSVGYNGSSVISSDVLLGNVKIFDDLKVYNVYQPDDYEIIHPDIAEENYFDIYMINTETILVMQFNPHPITPLTKEEVVIAKYKYGLDDFLIPKFKLIKRKKFTIDIEKSIAGGVISSIYSPRIRNPA